MTGPERQVWESFRRRIASTTSAITQHNGVEPQVEEWRDEDATLVAITWEEAPKKQRCIELPIRTWKALEKLAESTDSLSQAGPAAGSPSWRALIRRIAEGDLEVSPGPTVNNDDTGSTRQD